jgi:HEAT repeat protein
VRLLVERLVASGCALVSGVETAPLGRGERVLAMALHGVCPTVDALGLEARLHLLGGELDALLRVADSGGFEAARATSSLTSGPPAEGASWSGPVEPRQTAPSAGLAAPGPSPSWPLDRLETLWRTFQRSPPRARFPCAVLLALAPRLPLGLDGPDALVAVTAGAGLAEEDPSDEGARRASAALIGLAVGHAAASSDWHAAGLVRVILEDPRLHTPTGRALHLGIVRGLGDGRLRSGLDALLRLAEGALSQADAWWGGLARLWMRLVADHALTRDAAWPVAMRILGGLPDGSELAGELLAQVRFTPSSDGASGASAPSGLKPGPEEPDAMSGHPSAPARPTASGAASQPGDAVVAGGLRSVAHDLPGPMDVGVDDLALAGWFDFRGPQRALLLRHCTPREVPSPPARGSPISGVPAPGAVSPCADAVDDGAGSPARWARLADVVIRERHPDVIAELCSLPALPPDWARVLRACSDLQGPELQGRIASRIAALSREAASEFTVASGRSATPNEGLGADRHDALAPWSGQEGPGPSASLSPARLPVERPADIIVLPPAALARDDLDLLRAAIHGREGDRLGDLASRVPLDRRGECREALLGCLDIPDVAVRRGAISALGRVGGNADAKALVDVARRCRALEGSVAAALSALQAKGAVGELIELFVRRLKWADDEALDDLWQLAGASCVAFLLRGLAVRYYPLARAGAARALGRHRVQEAVFSLRTLALADSHEGTRQAAAQAVTDLHGAPPGADEASGYGLLYRPVDAFPETVARAREAGSEALPGLRRVLSKGSWRRREAACEVLATLPGEAAHALLLDALSDPDDDVRFAACEALTQRGWLPTTPQETTLAALASRRTSELEQAPERVDAVTLLASLRLGGHAFRTDVVTLLAHLGMSPTAGSEQALVLAASFDVEAALRQEAGLVAVIQVADQTWQTEPHRARVAAALSAVPAALLGRALDEARAGWRARQTVAEALSSSLDDDAPALLAELVADEEDDVRRASLQALAWCGLARHAAGLDTASVAAGFLRAFHSPFPDDRDQAALAAGALGPALLSPILGWIDDPWWETRHAAARTLAAWPRALDVAASQLVRLAVDPEYKVARAARKSLATLGVMPDIAGRVAAVSRATAASLDGAVGWFVSTGDETAPPELAAAIDHLIDTTPPDRLAQRLGLIPMLGVSHLASWLEESALGHSTGHIGLRLAASDALRGLVRPTCQVCAGMGRLSCPACDHSGSVTCQGCAGTGSARLPCPASDCTARQVTRRIDAPRCIVCHGRGQVRAPCACQATPTPGREPCALCAGLGTLPCVACSEAVRT